MASYGSAAFSPLVLNVFPTYNLSASSDHNWTEIYTYMRKRGAKYAIQERKALGYRGGWQWT